MRIDKAEIERVKQANDLASLIQSKGVKLVRSQKGFRVRNGSMSQLKPACSRPGLRKKLTRVWCMTWAMTPTMRCIPEPF
jgi:hypothetical protein